MDEAMHLFRFLTHVMMHGCPHHHGDVKGIDHATIVALLVSCKKFGDSFFMPPVGHVTAALAKVAAVASIAYDMLLESSMPTMLQYGSVDQAVGE